MVAQLTEGWDQSVWSRVARLLAQGVPKTLPELPKGRYRYLAPVRLTAAQVETLVAEYQAGASLAAVADKWGVHRTTAARHLGEAGITIRRGRRPAPILSSDRLEAAQALRTQGWTYPQIGQLYGCSGSGVSKALGRLVAQDAAGERPS